MEKPILFNTEMVQAILEGRKTTTRRIIKRTPSNDDPCGYGFWKSYEERDKRWYVKDYTHSCCWYTLEEYISKWSKYHVGDILYVRETWALCHALDKVAFNKLNSDWREQQIKENLIWYKADGEQTPTSRTIGERLVDRGRWRPSIHMPKEAARIFLKVTDVRIERLQDVTEDQAKLEGAYMPCYKCDTGELSSDSVSLFKVIWNSTLKKDQSEMYSWDANPWVWVIKFEKIEK